MRRRQWAIYSGLAVVGFAIPATVETWSSWLLPIGMKVSGRAAQCPWRGVVSEPGYERRVEYREAWFSERIHLQATDAKLKANLYSTPAGRSFWTPSEPEDGREMLTYLLADHVGLSVDYERWHVHRGDTVIDVGAHVGTFTAVALNRGASRVIAIEPDPRNRECLRRNFAPEITSGQVVVIAEGLWSYGGTLTLQESSHNSGMGSLIFKDSQAPAVQISVVTLDSIVAERKIPRVDFIKMDIEGAEREALKGAAKTLAQFHPRMMLDMYHRPDDKEVLPRVIRSAYREYRELCGPCTYGSGELQQHVMFFW